MLGKDFAHRRNLKSTDGRPATHCGASKTIGGESRTSEVAPMGQVNLQLRQLAYAQQGSGPIRGRLGFSSVACG